MSADNTGAWVECIATRGTQQAQPTSRLPSNTPRLAIPTGGYDAGTAARGGGTGGTTEAMTGGLAAGGAIGDKRRAGLGDIGRGQL